MSLCREDTILKLVDSVSSMSIIRGVSSYTIVPLPFGEYDVEVVAKGFSRLLQEHVTVDSIKVSPMTLNSPRFTGLFALQSPP